MLLTLTFCAAAAQAASGPSFDCAKAQGQVEQQVCSSPELSALDRQMAALYAKAGQQVDAAGLKSLKATQRGWIKGRDDCWKAADVAQCIRYSYQVRLIELQIQSGSVQAPTAVEFVCGDNSKPFSAAFYNQLEPRAVVITYGNDQSIGIAQPAASGSKYASDGMQFWEHQGEARVDWYGTALTCKPRR
ncbi:MliC family protein [Pseudomonas sp. UL073]|uniref:MliC family protein n=2 Tax=Zestomonas insulae TaxID=2809017 RepID=A0ABS2IFS4_9GAMM|nr:MliC family protein [Pseudomonas insulae]